MNRLDDHHEKLILNQYLKILALVLSVFAQNSLLTLLFTTEQKYTHGLVMESITQPHFLE